MIPTEVMQALVGLGLVVYGLFLAGTKILGGSKQPAATTKEMCDLRHQQIAADLAVIRAEQLEQRATLRRVEIALAERGREGRD